MKRWTSKIPRAFLSEALVLDRFAAEAEVCGYIQDLLRRRITIFPHSNNKRFRGFTTIRDSVLAIPGLQYKYEGMLLTRLLIFWAELNCPDNAFEISNSWKAFHEKQLSGVTSLVPLDLHFLPVRSIDGL